MNRLAVLASTVLLLGAAGCGSSSGSGATGSGTAGSTTTASSASSSSTKAAGASAKAVDGCTLVTPADLSQAVGVTYTTITSSLGTCNVNASDPRNVFAFSVNKIDATTTWKEELAVIKEDDGSVTPVSGIGDQAAQGAIKEFGVEAHGYVIDILNGDVNNPATAKDFTHSKAIAKLLIQKLGG